MAEWQHGLCGCFSDCGTCLLSYCVPCYLVGKDAEAVGDSCFLCGLGYLCIYGCVGAIVRKKVREKRNISGNFCFDFAVSCCCPFCSVAQTHQEVLAMNATAMAIERE